MAQYYIQLFSGTAFAVAIFVAGQRDNRNGDNVNSRV
jgi:hypothetical protein